MYIYIFSVLVMLFVNKIYVWCVLKILDNNFIWNKYIFGGVDFKEKESKIMKNINFIVYYILYNVLLF